MANTKNLRSVATALAPMAKGLPTQNVVAPRPAAAGEVEPVVQFSFALRKAQRKQLMRLADDADMTMRAFILEALKAKGLEVTDEDLLDLRKKG
ncbi:hypothetical protein [Rubrimonas cliftonensis]|uniref:Uncharacterized protein n=1 Tax=Rubrimonas cliftonensis TaxID=89524 RepID=A0A1H4FY58_9RHOB|nr:hypothetical protein [Rubrimonas cliftonensis]SEB02279.1 hypothetical protein SAMN05444370_13119 [Rubrimonas cliftonensis]